MADGAEYACDTMCDLIHAEGAEVRGVYTADFYAGQPCVTVNRLGAGAAWYVATRPEQAFLDDLYARLAAEAGLPVQPLPEGVQIARRGNVVFALNFSGAEQRVRLPRGTDLLTGAAVDGEALLPPSGALAVCVE